jgi:protein SCO1
MSLTHQRLLARLLLGSSIGLLVSSLAGFVWLSLKLSGKNLPGIAAPLPVLAQLPDFHLTDQTGNPMALADLEGKVWIADFIFTRCPGPCSRMTARMVDLQRELAGEADLRFVSFSVDPEFDTSEVLMCYAERFQADQTRWSFLTGAKKSMHELAKSGFLVGGVGDMALHTTRFILVDRFARVRGYYDSADEESLQKLLKDAKRLALEEA